MNPRRPDILPDQIHADTLADAGFHVTIRDTQGRLTGHARVVREDGGGE